MFISCASIINSNVTSLVVYSEKPLAVVHKKDTLKTGYSNGLNSVLLTPKRSKDSLQLTVIDDQVSKNINMPSKISFMYYMNAIPLFLPGFLIDNSNPKKYTYGQLCALDENLNIVKATTEQKKDYSRRKNKIHLKKTKPIIYRKSEEIMEKDVYLHLSFPSYSHTLLHPGLRNQVDRGSILGFSFGLDYYYKKNRFFNLSTNTTFAGYFQIGCGDDGADDQENIDISSISILHNHRKKYFSYGYGLNYSYVYWRKNEYPTNDFNFLYRKKRRYSTLGLAFNGNFYFYSFFYGGITYKPNFVRLKPSGYSTFKYEHQITIDLGLKLNLYRKKKG